MIHFIKYSLSSLLVLLILSSCNNKKEPSHQEVNNDLIQYAKNLSISTSKGLTEVKVLVDTNKEFTYLLYTDQKPTNKEADAFIKVPVQSIAATSTSQLPAFAYLNARAVLKGFQGTKWIYDETLKSQASSGDIKEIGQKQGINQELLLQLNPAVLMAYQVETGANNYTALEDAGTSIVYNVEYKEQTPLGRAEWIKFTGALVGKSAEADSIFKAIESNYLSLMQKVDAIEKKPKVMTGIMYGDSWYVPGGKNYGSQLIQDAGGEYLWKDNPSSASLALGYEAVLTKAQNADFWIGTASIESYEELANTDERYTYFKAFQNKNVFTYTKRVNELGSNDYLESGYLRPDLILADHIKILHPQLDTAKYIDFTYFKPFK